MMKRLIIAIVCLASVAGVQAQTQADSQQGKGRRQFSPEMYRQKLEEFVTHEAGLTAAEAQKFYPLLHEMFAKQRKNSDEARDVMKACKDGTSEEQYQQALDKALSVEIENKKIEKDYYQKFHSTLTWQKIHKVRIALFKFQMVALKNFEPHKQKADQHRQKGEHKGPHPHTAQVGRNGK